MSQELDRLLTAKEVSRERGEIMQQDTLISRTAVEKWVGLTRSSIYVGMREGRFPLPLKVGPKAVRWRSSDIEAWIDSRPLATGRE